MLKTSTYKFDATELTATEDQEKIAEGTKFANDYITVCGTITKRTKDKNNDLTMKSTELAKEEGGYYEFTVTGTADVKLSVSSTGGSNDSVIGIVDKDGKVISNKEGKVRISTSTAQTLTYESLPAGTYKIIVPKNTGETGEKDNNIVDLASVRGARVYSIEITETTGGTRPPRADWSEVAAPVLGTVSIDGSKVTVEYTMVTGYDGADSVTIEMKSSDGEVVATKSASGTATGGKLEFTPASSGDYTFAIKASRKGCDDKKGGHETTVTFTLPLAKAVIGSAYSKGNGSVALEWSAVKEATSYNVEYSSDKENWTAVPAELNTEAVVSGLSVGTRYNFRIVAYRNAESTTSDIAEVTVTEEAQQKWGFITYGNGASSSKDSYKGGANDGSLTVKSASGKLVPASFDGLSFYYTQVPASLNFTLRAKVDVDKWTFSNGQEGFGLMAADKLGGSGWNNSYMAVASKTEFYWDDETKEVTTDSTKTKISHYLGIASQEKMGLNKDNISKIEANDSNTIKNDFKSTMYPLEQRYNDYATFLGNYTNSDDKMKQPIADNKVTDMYLTIQKNNTGYFVTYESADGRYKTTKKYYEPDALEQLDSENVYVGFFAARNATVTFSDITFTTINPEDDAPAEERPIEKVAVNTNIQSATATGSSDYEFLFSANCDGELKIIDSEGNYVAQSVEVKADTLVKPGKVTLKSGKNDFKFYFTPDPDYKPGDYKLMESYATKEIDFSVTYKRYGSEGQALYVAPDASGTGTSEDPMSIYEAVKYAQPGQQIILKAGIYKLSSTLKIARGVNGTANSMIYMIGDPNDNGRPLLDFQGLCAGMIMGGDYWYFKGFDVTNSANGQKGIQVSGSHCVLDKINAYHNGNTGIQISRLNSTDTYAEWPSYNLILNCTSFGNADGGYEDADGFAAKLTVGDGNVFDGCIAHHNADDGWDLFAKVQTGSIGSVTIQNSVAYANGYLEDGTNAGNGNGFKMGGDSMPGAHKLINSVAYNNKAKGIDSNSCPDIKVENCTSFNNESYNVAFYTNTAANTDYEANGVISFRTEYLNVAENIKPKGSQDNAKIYGDTNYYWDETGAKSVNTSGAAVDETWFVSLDTNKVPSRNADGTINMNGLLVLTDAAPEGVGAVINGKASSNVKPIPPTNEGSGSTGSGSSDNDSDSSSGSSDSESSGSSSDTTDVLKPEEIPGATVTQIEGTDFAEIAQISDGAAKVVSSIDTNGQVKESVKVDKTSSEVANTVISKINSTGDKNITSYASEETSVSKAVFDKLKETGKTLTLGIVDKDGKVNSIVTIDGSKLKGQSVDFNLKITVNAKDNSIEKVAEKAGINESKYSIINFEYSGTLPGTLMTAVKVSDKFADGTKLALYYFNKNKGTLENQYQLSTVSDGFAEFAIDHCSEYVLVDASAAQGTLTTGVLGSPKTADVTSVIIWLMVMIVAFAALFMGFKYSRRERNM